MAVAGMNHFTILTDDVDNTVRFYGDFLGLEPGPRPNFNFPGAWLYAGGAADIACHRRTAEKRAQAGRDRPHGVQRQGSGRDPCRH